MDHGLDDDVMKLRFQCGIRQLSTNDAVDVLWCDRLVLCIEGDEDVGMREPPLLELDDIQASHHLPQHLMLTYRQYVNLLRRTIGSVAMMKCVQCTNLLGKE
jgi:hypothetical protein